MPNQPDNSFSVSYNRHFVALGEATRPALDRIGEAGELPRRMGEALDAIASASDDRADAVEEVASLCANLNRSPNPSEQPPIDTAQR